MDAVETKDVVCCIASAQVVSCQYGCHRFEAAAALLAAADLVHVCSHTYLLHLHARAFVFARETARGAVDPRGDPWLTSVETNYFKGSQVRG